MKNRKNDSANLEKMKGVFRGLGYVMVISLVFLAFSMKTYNKVSYDFKVSIDEMQEELPPLIAPATPPPPPPPPPAQKPPPQEPELEIVDNEEEVEEEEFDDTDEEDLEVEEGIEDEGEEEVLEQAPLTFVKDMPHYKDCKDGNNMQRNACTRQMFVKYISQNFVYPDIARDMGLEGTVWVQFVVAASGKVEKVQVIKPVHKYLDDAAVKAVSKLPPLIPGKQLDKPVPVLYKVPVKILLN